MISSISTELMDYIKYDPIASLQRPERQTKYLLFLVFLLVSLIFREIDAIEIIVVLNRLLNLKKVSWRNKACGQWEHRYSDHHPNRRLKSGVINSMNPPTNPLK